MTISVTADTNGLGGFRVAGWIDTGDGRENIIQVNNAINDE